MVFFDTERDSLFAGQGRFCDNLRFLNIDAILAALIAITVDLPDTRLVRIFLVSLLLHRGATLLANSGKIVMGGKERSVL